MSYSRAQHVGGRFPTQDQSIRSLYTTSIFLKLSIMGIGDLNYMKTTRHLSDEQVFMEGRVMPYYYEVKLTVHTLYKFSQLGCCNRVYLFEPGHSSTRHKRHVS